MRLRSGMESQRFSYRRNDSGGRVGRRLGRGWRDFCGEEKRHLKNNIQDSNHTDLIEK